MGEEDILLAKFAREFAPIAGLKNVLIYKYINIDWKEIYKNLLEIELFYKFMNYIKKWLSKKK